MVPSARYTTPLPNPFSVRIVTTDASTSRTMPGTLERSPVEPRAGGDAVVDGASDGDAVDIVHAVLATSAAHSIAPRSTGCVFRITTPRFGVIEYTQPLSSPPPSAGQPLVVRAYLSVMSITQVQ
jgi:hypothetical protein